MSRPPSMGGSATGRGARERGPGRSPVRQGRNRPGRAYGYRALTSEATVVKAAEWSAYWSRCIAVLQPEQ